MPMIASGQTNCDPAVGLVDASCPQVLQDLADADEAAKVGPHGIQLSPLEVGKDVDIGCGCHIRLLGERPLGGIFLAWTTSDPVMRLNGKLLKLRITQSSGTRQRKDVTSIGDTQVIRLVASGVRVRFDGRVVSACDSNENECEGEEASEGSLSVSVRSRSHSFPARCECGC
jgi:hypothetical protein